jgi:phosphoglycolate phosphatase
MPSSVRHDLLVFDLDGTLCDSAQDISDSLRRVLERLGRPPVAHEDVVRAIGAGVRKLIERTTPAPFEPVVEAFMKEYAEHLLDRTRLYPGVAETLAKLPGRKIVLSNKPTALTRRVVEGLGIARYFEAAYGGDSFPERKPDAACFRRAAGDARAPLMIGDSGTDVATARNAGVPVCVVTYGYFKPGELDGADHRIDRFDQLLELLR